MQSSTPTKLLADDELPPVGEAGQDGVSTFVVVCDHAGRLLPRSLGSLGLSEDQLASHIAWDIGAAGVARRLAILLGCCVVWQRYSRLVIDCNRPLGAFDSIATRSERTLISGNQHVGPLGADARAREVFHPYHDRIRQALDQRREMKQSTVLVAVHSFTPVFLDVVRPWHVGVLYNRDARLADPLLRLLEDEGDLVVGRNEPYAANELSDFTIVHHGEQREIPYVELEIRQDLIADEAGQASWAARFARLLPIAAQCLPSDASRLSSTITTNRP